MDRKSPVAGETVHVSASVGLFMVVPQLFLSTQVSVLVPSMQSDQSEHNQSSVHSGVVVPPIAPPVDMEHVCDSVGLFLVVPHLLSSLHVLVCVPAMHSDQSVQFHFSVQVGGNPPPLKLPPPLVVPPPPPLGCEGA